MIKLIIATFILVLLAVAGLGIKLLFDRKAQFTGGSCQATNSSEALNSKGITCGCGGSCESEVSE